MIREYASDDRGVMSPVAHSMTIAITSLLIIGLLLSATALLENQQETATREELRTVGNRIAADIGQVDALAQQGGAANVTTEHVSEIAGSTYTVSLEKGTDDCDTDRFTVTSETVCLRLSSTDRDVTQYVPVDNESAVRLRSGSDGAFHLSAERQTAPTEFSTRAQLDLNARGGIGRDVNPNGVVLGNAPGNRPPVAKFTFSPGSPQAGEDVMFDASGSRDPDGSIDSYLWDWDNDGVYEESTSSATITHPGFSPGTRNVSLRVEDNQGSSSNFTKFIDVTGLIYEGDLTNTAGDNHDIQFSVTNNFGRDIEITHLMVDPADDIDHIDNDDDPEIFIDGSGVFNDEFGEVDLHDGGRIIELEDYTTLSDGGTSTIEIHGFENRVDGEPMDIGVQYILNSTPNSTIFSDSPGGPSLSNYRLTATGTDVDLVFDSNIELSSVDIEIGGDTNATLDIVDLAETSTGSGYEYRYDISDGTSGYFWANLTSAEGDGEEAGKVPFNDSAVTTSGPYVWASATDWDEYNTSFPSDVIHSSFGDHSADRLELGYPTFDRGGDNLVGYWPLDDVSSPTPDASGKGNDGVVIGTPDESFGIFDTNSFNLNGSREYVRVQDSQSLEVTDENEVTVSAWIRRSPGSGTETIFQHGESYNLHVNGDEVAFTIETDSGELSAEGGNLDPNQWYHVVGVWDGSDAEIYVDGSWEGWDNGPWFGTDIDSDNADAGLGGNPNDPSQDFEGQIDEVRVYNRSVSDPEDLYDMYSEGEITTDWQVGSAINGSDVGIQYNVSNGADESIEVTVHSRNDGTVEMSDSVNLGDGTGTVSVSGLSQEAAEYRIRVELGSTDPTESPSVNSLEVVDTS